MIHYIYIIIENGNLNSKKHAAQKFKIRLTAKRDATKAHKNPRLGGKMGNGGSTCMLHPHRRRECSRSGQLGLFDSLIGATVSASAAINTLIGIDNVLVIALGDDAHGAGIGASTTLYASIGDTVSHNDSLLSK